MSGVARMGALVLASAVAVGCGGSSHPRITGGARSSAASAPAAGGNGGSAQRSTGGNGSSKKTPGKPPPAGQSTKRPVAPGGRDVGPTTTYSGTGDQTIGRLVLARDAALHWTVSGGRFSLASRGLRVSGSGFRGQSFARAGAFKNVHVTAKGAWKLTIQLLGAPA